MRYAGGWLGGCSQMLTDIATLSGVNESGAARAARCLALCVQKPDGSRRFTRT